MKPEYLEYFKNLIEGTSEQTWEVWFEAHQQQLKDELPQAEFLRLKLQKLEQAELYLRDAKIPYIPLAAPGRFRELHRLTHVCSPARIVAAEPNLLFVCTRDGMFVWDSDRGQLQTSIEDMDENTRQAVSVLALSPDGKYLASGAADFTTKVYDTTSGERLVRLSKLMKERNNSAEQLCFSADGALLAAAMGRRIEVFRVPDWEKLYEFKGHTSKAHLLQCVPGSNLFVSAGGKYVKLWNAATGTEVYEFPVFKRLLGSLAVSADGSVLATGGEDGLVMLWSLPERTLLQTYKQHGSQVFGLAVSPDASIIASSELKGSLHLWRADDGKTLYQHSPGCAPYIEFSPDGKLAVAASDRRRVSVLEIGSGSCLGMLPASSDIAFLGNNSLASADGNDVVIWQLSGASG